METTETLPSNSDASRTSSGIAGRIKKPTANARTKGTIVRKFLKSRLNPTMASQGQGANAVLTPEAKPIAIQTKGR
ncbi:MAG: hypothetical protein KF836_03900 [Fimbriimonadaceae bacterium]|nr:hypothetical protein [Fimbriimonadaceae bacterium]